MKYTGLRKLLAVCLVIISLSTLVSGFFGLRSSAKDRRKNEEELADIQSSIDDYRSIIALQMDGVDYDSLKETLEKQQKTYDKDTNRHKKDLAAFTATNGGLEAGAQALAQAEAAMASGKTQYEAGKRQLELQAAAFQTIYDTAMAGKQQLEDSLPILDAAETAVKSLRNLLESLHRIGDIMELPEEGQSEETENAEEAPEDGADEDALSEESEADSKDEQEDKEDTQDSDEAAEDVVNEDPQEQNTEKETPQEQGSEENGKDSAEGAGNNSISDDSDNPEGKDRLQEEAQNEGESGDRQPVDTQLPSDPSKSAEDEEQKKEEASDHQQTDSAQADGKSATATTETLATATDNTEQPDRKQKETADDVQTQMSNVSEPEPSSVPTSPQTGAEDNQEAMRQSALEAYDAAISTYQDALFVIDALQDRAIPTTAIKEMLKKEGITEPEELKALVEQAGIEVTAEQEKTLEDIMMQDSVVLFTSEQVAEFKTGLEEAVGMPLEDLMVKMQNERDAIAAGEEVEYELNADQFGTVRRAYTDNKEAILRMADVIEEELPALEEALKLAKTQLSEADEALGQVENAKKAMDQGLSAMSTVESGIAQGEQMLAQGAAQLEETRKKQNEKAEELETEKRKLKQTEQELQQLSESADMRKKLEERERSVRLALLSREEIRQRTDSGAELLDASEGWYEELKQQTARNYRVRFNAAILMIICCIMAVIAALAILGQTGNPGIFAAATVLCLVCAGTAGLLLVQAGRGISYSSALVTAVAALQMVLTLFSGLKPTGKAESATGGI